MYKVVWFARYTPNKPKPESDRYWAEVHGPLFAKVPGVERYVQSHVTGTLPAVGGYSEDSTYFDGYSCAWFTDKAAFEAAMLSPEWAGRRRGQRQRLRRHVVHGHERPHPRGHADRGRRPARTRSSTSSTSATA